MNISPVNVWKLSFLHIFANTRFYDSLPLLWQSDGMPLTKKKNGSNGKFYVMYILPQ